MDRLVGGRLLAAQRDELGDVGALIADPFHTADAVQDRGDDSQITRDRRLASQQRQHPLLDLHIAPVDPVIGGDHQRRELDVVGADGCQRPIELFDGKIDALQRLGAQLVEVLVKLMAGLSIARP